MKIKIGGALHPRTLPPSSRDSSKVAELHHTLADHLFTQISPFSYVFICVMDHVDLAYRWTLPIYTSLPRYIEFGSLDAR